MEGKEVKQKMVEIFDRLCAEKGISPYRLSELGIVSQSTISAWRKHPSSTLKLDSLLRLADYFEVSLDYLTGRTEQRQPFWSPGNGPVAVRVPVFGPGWSVGACDLEAEPSEGEFELLSLPYSDGGEYIAIEISDDFPVFQIRRGDIAIVRRQHRAASGDLALVRPGPAAPCGLRRYTESEGGIILSPLDLRDPEYFSGSQIRGLPVSITGVIVEIRSRLCQRA